MLNFGIIGGGVAGVVPIPPDPLDLFPTGHFNTQADFDSWTDTTGDWIWDAVDLQADKNGASSGNQFTYDVVLEVGATYELNSVAIFDNNPRYYVNNAVNFDVLIGQPLQFVADTASQSIGITTDTALIDLSSISLKKIS